MKILESLSPAARAEVIRAARNHNYEITESGIFIPGANLKVGGVFTTSINDGDEFRDENIHVNEGLNHYLAVTIANGAQNANWYIGVYENTYDPQPSDTAGTIATSSGESNKFTNPTLRKAYVINAGDPVNQSLSNTDSKAVFIATEAVTLRGGFLISEPTVNSTAGVLLAATQFSAEKILADAEELNVAYSIDAADA